MFGAGIAIGVGFAVALGVTLDNIAIWIAMGSGMDVATGMILERGRQDSDGDG
jgi:hypothetical protein